MISSRAHWYEDDLPMRNGGLYFQTCIDPPSLEQCLNSTQREVAVCFLKLTSP